MNWYLIQGEQTLRMVWYAVLSGDSLLYVSPHMLLTEEISINRHLHYVCLSLTNKKRTILQHSTWYHLIHTNTVHASHHSYELLCCGLRYPHSYFTHLAECSTLNFVSEPKRLCWELKWEERLLFWIYLFFTGTKQCHPPTCSRSGNTDAQLQTERNSSRESQFVHVSILRTELTEVAHCIRMFLRYTLKKIWELSCQKIL